MQGLGEADMERAVLGSVMLEPSLWENIEKILDGDSFSCPDCRHIWYAMADLVAEGTIPDTLTVPLQLKKKGLLDLSGGALAVIKLTNVPPTPSSALAYAEAVAESARKRKLLWILDAAREKLADGTAVAAATMSDIINASASLDVGTWGDAKSLNEELDAALDAIEKQERDEDGSFIKGLDSGFTEINDLTAGLHPGQLIVLAAYPSQGKTAISLSMARCAAERSKAYVASLEMPRSEIVTRLICMESMVDMNAVRKVNSKAPLRNSEWTRLAEARVSLGAISKNLIIDDDPDVSIAGINARLERENGKARRGEGRPVRLLVIDYLQLMDLRGENQTEAISDATKLLKRTAKRWTRMGFPLTILLLSQLTKPKHEDIRRGILPRPNIRDLRGSGQISADADVVAFVYRAEPFFRAQNRPAGEHAGVGEFIIAKQRNGPIGIAQLQFHEKSARFTDPPRQWASIEAPSSARPWPPAS